MSIFFMGISTPAKSIPSRIFLKLPILEPNKDLQELGIKY